MKLITLILILISFTLNCIALEVILNPYESIDYESSTLYIIDGQDAPCACDCYESEENHFNQAKRNWWD